jgi:GTP-binding protein HflX
MLQTAIVTQRVSNGDPDTTEIRRLTEAAGARVVGAVTQTRHADPGTELGAGKVREVDRLVDETGADTVVVDGELTPRQTVNLEEEVGASVLDRHRVVLEIFASQAGDQRSQLQVELARLRYKLPRVRERADEGILNRQAEKGTRYYDIEDRIADLERRLSELGPVDEQLRNRRREEGFDLIALAGYTNAGKSTLLRRLADEMSLGAETHEDLDETAAAEDKLFKTLETTHRRATIEGRKTIVTDTVGFLEDLPHWLVESFRGTLAAVEAADAVVVVVDIAQETDELNRKLTAVSETLGSDHPPVVPALNKADLADADTQRRRTETVTEFVDTRSEWRPPLVISAREDGGLSTLRQKITAALPDLERETLSIPLTDDGMSLLSWLYDNAATVSVSYESERMTVDIEAKSQIIDQARARATDLREHSATTTTRSG